MRAFRRTHTHAQMEFRDWKIIGNTPWKSAGTSLDNARKHAKEHERKQKQKNKEKLVVLDVGRVTKTTVERHVDDLRGLE
jgi:hypothetical protein